MKQWQQSQIIITASTIPVALLVCWWIYKKTSSSQKQSSKSSYKDSNCSPLAATIEEDEMKSTPVLRPTLEEKTDLHSNVKDAVLVSSEQCLQYDTFKGAGDSIAQSVKYEKDQCSAKSFEQTSVPLQDTTSVTHKADIMADSKSLNVCDAERESCEVPGTSNTSQFEQDKIADSEGEESTLSDPYDKITTNQSENVVSESPISTEDQLETATDTVCVEEEDSAYEKDLDANINNNNNLNNGIDVEVLKKEKNEIGSEDSGCECCKSDSVVNGKIPCTNGCNHSESGEEANDDASTDHKKSFHRPSDLPSLDGKTNGTAHGIEVFVEFPSERVGLLIGKQGRNIKQLKQDSGADIFVHEAPMRDDIQVLQICGTQTEVESCVSRIKRRFNDISLNHYDGDNLIIPSPNSNTSPMNTPPPNQMYPVPNISQLRLPDGINVEVAVSAIADVDCVFLQQYTHPTFMALTNLERAMTICYAEPSTPDVPHPIQVGLICAVQQQGLWYRSQIMQCFEESEEVTIKFMDYGGYATVHENSLKQIRADFVTLPFQATECYMDNIAPPNNEKFCEDSVKKLQEMLQDGRFQARVTGYRGDGNPRIHLFKCTRNEILLINQEMATKGLATWVEPAPYPCT